jgi:TPP-dependent pyruvate/acetoin dehydrogenase alpha subunit
MKIALTDERPDIARRTLAPHQLKSIYRQMLRIRLFEERTAELFREGVVKGTARRNIATYTRRTTSTPTRRTEL